jgi:hypothetical protein
VLKIPVGFGGSDRLTSLVEEFYGLKKAPFMFERGREPALMTESLRSAANSLREGLEGQAPILSIHGARGIGTSSLVRRGLPKLVGDEWKITDISGSSENWEPLGPTLAREFRVDPRRLARDPRANGGCGRSTEDS